MFTPPSPYTQVLDRHCRPDGRAVLAITSAVPPERVTGALREAFALQPGMHQIDVELDGVLIGATSVHRLAERDDADRGPIEVGAGDGATLPGASAHWQLLAYGCPHPGCDHTRYALIDTDDTDLPPCPRAGHGRLRRHP
jgi:hypothetical protein